MAFIRMIAEYHGKVLPGVPRLFKDDEIEVLDDAAQILIDRGLAIYAKVTKQEASTTELPTEVVEPTRAGKAMEDLNRGRARRNA